MRVASEFVRSAADAGGFPSERLPELAVVGRSNVGKSSLINALVGRKVARASAEPGKTRLANFFRVTPEGRPAFFLVDLPGYGYARAPRAGPGGGRAADRRQAAREAFDRLAEAYFDRPAGVGDPPRAVLLLVDSRHPGLDADVRAWAWIERLGVRCRAVATKVDALTRAERQRHLAEFERRFTGPVEAVSARTGEGLDALWKTIARLLSPA